MKPPIAVANCFLPLDGADALFFQLTNELEWIRRDTTPRLEYYTDTLNRPYTYGSGLGIRTYKPGPTHRGIEAIRFDIAGSLRGLGMPAWNFEAVFLNRYLDASMHLGWHADDSPELDDERPIPIVSLGAEREIWFRPIEDPTDVTKVLLKHGSCCLMLPHMQEKWQHRIPKAGRTVGERISLTFRGVHPPKEESHANQPS